MPLVRRYRVPALCCALAVLLCELLARPYAKMGICDDGPYILMARTLANTGHVVYNGWPAAMLGWQLYLGAAFIKLFGFSFTTVRMSTVLVAMVLAFVLQRTLVADGVTERNATIGTLVLVLSPLYLVLSLTYMSDLFGLFAIVLCLYGCLRALQAPTSRSTILWLCFAVASNALFGTARQIAWLGTLVMVPSTLWLLRAQRRVLLAGAAATVAGALFVFGCMHWLAKQPYVQPEHILPSTFPVAHTLKVMIFFLLDIPFLLLPLFALFLPEIRKHRPRMIALLSFLMLGYVLLATYGGNPHDWFHLEPTWGDWINAYGFVRETGIKGMPPSFFHPGVLVLLTIASLGGALCLVASFFRSHPTPPSAPFPAVSWKRLGVLLAPFTLAYALLLIPRAATVGLSDRYSLGLILPALLWLVLYYQHRIQPRLPVVASVAMVAIMACCGIMVTHNTFAFYRARVTLADELRTDGVPDTSVDNGWEYNLGVELQHADHINYPDIVTPVHAYIPTPPLPAGTCPMFFHDETPHIHPLYGVSFEPNQCYGSAPFAPVSYSRWPFRTPGMLYVVRYTALPKH